MANTILLSGYDAEKRPGCPLPGRLFEKDNGVHTMADWTKEEIEAIVEAAVARAMKGVFAVGLTEVVHCAVTKALQGYEHECILDFSSKEIEAVQTLFDVVKATGHGDLADGIEEIRENHSFTCRLRKKLDKAGDTITSCVLKAVMTILLTATGVGLVFFFFIKGGGGQPSP